MFRDLYDGLTLLWSWRWPTVQGNVTDVTVERFTNKSGPAQTLRLSVAYEFYVGTDGPYTGETNWTPAFSSKQRIKTAHDRIRKGHFVPVRYRPHDPSVNRLDGSVWRA